MQLIVQIVSLLCTYALIVIFKYKTEHNFKIDLKVPYIKIHKAYLIIGVVLSTVFAVLSAWLFLELSKALSFLAFIFAVLWSLLVFSYFGFRIVFDEEKITYRYFFEKPKHIFYKEIVEIRHGLDLIIQTKDQKLVIPSYMTNVGALLLKMMPYLPKRKKVKEVEKVRSFFDSVERPLEFVIVFVMLEVVFIALFVWFLIASHFDSRVIAIMGVCLGAITALVFLCVHSAKRAHSSAFWRKVANLLFKKGYLRD